MRKSLWTVTVVLALAAPPGVGSAGAPSADPLDRLRDAAGGRIEVQADPATGFASFVRATEGAVLLRDDAARAPLERALAFLGRFGSVVGMSEADRAGPAAVLALERVETDPAGNRHVRLRQTFRGVPVFAGDLVVHMNARGITAVNGTFVPAVDVPVVPHLTRSAAEDAALAAVGVAGARAIRSELSVFRSGLVEGFAGRNALAWGVEVEGAAAHEQLWLDATTGGVFLRYELSHRAKDRCVYTPRYEESDPNLFAVRKENDPPRFVPPIDNLFDFTGQVYDLFANAFDRDSFDGEGATMRTVYLIDDNCPNAYWNGSTTNYCPGFDTDDIVAHEWGHAYTQHTGGLVYAYQPGALNESYSDIWGEVIDLTNGRDGLGGTNNAEPFPNGVRWLVGEDLTLNDRVARRVGLRDMWDPERVGFPGRVRGPNFVCGETDNGGVHYNSSVPNHAFAMLVDGKTYNDQTVAPIGLTKAAHLHWQAQLAYQTRATKFAEHALALKAACQDLLGEDLATIPSGVPSGEALGAPDCEQVDKAMLATQMQEPLRCVYAPLLGKNPPAVCGDAEVLLAEDFEDGLAGWALGAESVFPGAPTFAWAARDSLPGGRPGSAAFAVNARGSNCSNGYVLNDMSGRFWMESPPITVPASPGALTLRFDHYVETSKTYDGGNVMIQAGDGEWQVLPQAAYTYNPPNQPLAGPVFVAGISSNPKAGQPAWTGFDQGEITGSWGTTVADLSSLVVPGTQFRLRWEFGIDHCYGMTGWFVDDISVSLCPAVQAVVRED